MLTVQLIIIFLPLAFLASIALQRQANFFRFLISTLALSMGTALVWVIMPWDVVSVYWRMAMPLLLLVAIVMGFRRIGTAKKEIPRWLVITNLVINLLLIGFFSLINMGAIAGYMVPADTIELASPLPEGRFVVGQGGGGPFLNGHSRVAPQNHALDIVGVNAFGARFKPFADRSDLRNYAIFGASIHAPCAGEVLVSHDGLEDLTPGQTDRENLAGNYVVIACHGVEVVLAHMQKGSVLVSPGQQVSIGDPLGRVGNSGNTSEPHLHIHAERGGEAGEILNGEAVAFTIDGRFLVRNSRLPR